MFWMHLSLLYKLSRPQSIHLLLDKYLLDFAAKYYIYIFFFSLKMPMNHNHCKYSQVLLLLLLAVKGPLLDCAVKFNFAFNICHFNSFN